MIIRIKYENGNWIIFDGDGEKASTNGIWYLVKDYIEIETGNIFKVGSTSFETKLYSQ